MKIERCSNFLARLGIILVLLSLSIGPTRTAQVSSGTRAGAPETAGLLTFTSAAHVVGFNSQGIYAAMGSHALHVDFVDTNNVRPQADSSARPSGTNALTAESASLSRVQYLNLWKGINLIVDAPPDGILRTTYQLEPGADASTIQLHYNAAPEIKDDGSLSIAFETGALHESAPRAWQAIDGKQVAVAVRFAQHNNVVGFTLGQYDARYPLTIDPTLTWTTILGSIDPVNYYDSGGHGLAVDVDGNVFVAGSSPKPWSCSPASCTVRPFSTANSGFENGFVAKLNSSGVLQWNTFLGGSGGIQRSYDIALDGSGNVYVVGWSGGEWGCVPESACPTGGSDAYVAKLNPSGELQWATFFGNSVGNGITLDGDGNIYLAAKSLGTRTCTPSCTVLPHVGGWDALVAKLNPGGVLQWNTYLGAGNYGVRDEDSANAIAVDANGYVYVEGDSEATWGTPVRPYNPGDGSQFNRHEAFAAKLNPDGSLQWNTFLGGPGDEWGWNEHFRGIAADEDGNVYVTGDSTLPWSCSPVACTMRAFTFTSGSVSDTADAYVAGLNSSGVLQWNTFLGGEEDDAGRDIAVDGSGNVYMVGGGSQTWGNPERPHSSSGGDAFAAEFNPGGTLLWNTFLNGRGADEGEGLARDSAGNIYMSGMSGDDVFAAKFPPPSPPPPVTNTEVLKSISAQDGWILESNETSGKGGTMNVAGGSLNLGDDTLKRQYRAILSFNTGSLPDDAVITNVTLKIKKQGQAGANPFATLGNIVMDIRKGAFSNSSALQIGDFQVTPTRDSIASIKNKPLTGNWYKAVLPNTYFGFINKTGVTQFRLRFSKDDNNNSIADYLTFYSGNYGTSSYRPTLVIEYQMP